LHASIRFVEHCDTQIERTHMTTKIIVSYDGTENDRDALALGRLLGSAGATVALAYVRHAHESESGRERLADNEAKALLETGAVALGHPDVLQHVVLAGSTPEGLRGLALAEQADLIIFGSEYRTAAGHVDPQASARRLLDGGPVALAFAPAGFADQAGYSVRTIAAIGEAGDPCARETAEALAFRLGATIPERARSDVDLLVVGSRPGTVTGRVTISAAAEYLIELSTCPVVVVPRGVTVRFGS
jgi:nucleotide-binding universal stress UspA family protein